MSLEKLITIEKYLVRLPDEFIYNRINEVVEHCQNKGIPRRRQAYLLSLCSGYLFSGAIFYDFKVDIQNKSADHLLEFMKATGGITALAAYFTEDLLDLMGPEIRTAASNYEVASYRSWEGKARPYILSSAFGLIGWGISHMDITYAVFGISTLPYALSLYVRDDQSGGFLKKVRERMRDFFRKPLPAIQ